jgi:hypothetical protein
LACWWFSEILYTHLNHLNLLEYALSRAALTPTTAAMISMDMDSWWTAGFGYDLLPIYPPSRARLVHKFFGPKAKILVFWHLGTKQVKKIRSKKFREFAC